MYFPEYKSHFKKFACSTCDLYYCGCEKRGAYRRFHAYTYTRAIGGSMATKRCSYTAAFKLKLVEYAERHGNRCAGREFDVCEKLIRDPS